MLSRGSSPLARGLQVLHRSIHDLAGIIPARAGFTRSYTIDPNGTTDHPRSRGVYHRDPFSQEGSLGSSPLARGLQINHPNRNDLAGIIPARAGFTPQPLLSRELGADHPRSRGVYLLGERTEWCSAGSSPLARGLLGDLTSSIGEVGIIPARAGFTVRSRLLATCSGDHPRSRGVYGFLPGECSYCRGIIPARAGFTRPHGRDTLLRPDHPRSRGVYVGSVGSAASVAGSSPLARGLLCLVQHAREPRRIIPARAGVTPLPRSDRRA